MNRKRGRRDHNRNNRYSSNTNTLSRRGDQTVIHGDCDGNYGFVNVILQAFYLMPFPCNRKFVTLNEWLDCISEETGEGHLKSAWWHSTSPVTDRKLRFMLNNVRFMYINDSTCISDYIFLMRGNFWEIVAPSFYGHNDFCLCRKKGSNFIHLRIPCVSFTAFRNSPICQPPYHFKSSYTEPFSKISSHSHDLNFYPHIFRFFFVKNCTPNKKFNLSLLAWKINKV